MFDSKEELVHRGGPHVLVVERSEDESLALCQLLQTWGALTHAASLGEDLETLLARQPYQLVLLSIKDDVTGVAASLRRLRGVGCNAATPVVVIAREAQAAEIRMILEAGANDFLTAPTSVRAVARVYWHWVSERQEARP
jgi:CheY-like chemotaxis protein